MFILISKSAICARNAQSSAGAGRAQRIAGTANVAPVVVCNESKSCRGGGGGWEEERLMSSSDSRIANGWQLTRIGLRQC